MRCRLFSDEYAKKYGAAEYKHRVLLISLVLVSSGVFASLVCVVVMGWLQSTHTTSFLSVLCVSPEESVMLRRNMSGIVQSLLRCAAV
jgi:hypothetical protein